MKLVDSLASVFTAVGALARRATGAETLEPPGANSQRLRMVSHTATQGRRRRPYSSLGVGQLTWV